MNIYGKEITPPPRTQHPTVASSDRTPIFQSVRPFQLRTSDRRVYVYFAGCPSLKALAKALPTAKPLPIFKLGVTSCGHLKRRLEALGRDHYGNCYFDGSRMIIEAGFDHWDLQEIIANPKQSPLIKIGARHLVFDLPAGMTIDEFDAELRATFADLSLKTIVEDLNLSQKSASRFNRFTSYAMGVESRLSSAIELACLKTRVEGDDIVARIASLLARLHAKQR